MGLTQVEKDRAEAKGWKVGSVAEFLELTPSEELAIEFRLSLTELIKARRKDQALSQRRFAKIMGSSQSRIAKIEANDPSVSIDLLIKAAGVTGATISDVADAIRPRK